MRLVLAGTGSAVGKTTISTGIMKALSHEQEVQPYKAGPDYIDTTYHTMATGNVSRNLDSFFMSDGQIREAFERGLKISNSKIGVIEGVRGLYEGISPTGDVGNTASIAKALNAPVVLILNSRSLVKSAAAIVIGFKTLDPTIRIEGVILNLVKNRKHYLKTKEAVEKLADTPVIGGIPRDDAISVEQRHLGLVPAVERENIKRNIEDWGRVMEENIDLDALVNIMKGAGKLPEGREPLFQQENTRKVKIGIARDEVFTFYYQDNLEALESNNAKLVYFSPLHDAEVPDVDGIYIGGGYPEIFARELEANQSMRKSVEKFHQEGRPIYAECGGLMYLTRSINQHQMCDVFGYHSHMTKKPQALSYVIARAEHDNIIIPEGETFHGHEFHYSKLELEGQKPKFAFNILRGRGVVDSMDGLMSKNTLASYVHTHVAACPTFASRLVKTASGDY
ncbi:Ni-sirohydrochlorin a,c-diamide synthase [Methanobacterium sp.]|uniref:Ni-sirohydrochlorin a,c-diamide synthase n=1 Tax=Methanobacterium sp. TaxID=2164 RepID=UPI002ABCE1EB|nr:Ni-sirohydrochlorin a,c-diamide synthase [Methanobacterium sp.]MDY9924116.1 Ni-sirohydrochlorin a,c-diamide synthase [Methanobacterium sp.]